MADVTRLPPSIKKDEDIVRSDTEADEDGEVVDLRKVGYAKYRYVDEKGERDREHNL